MFSKQHYEAVAETLSALKPKHEYERMDQWIATVDRFTTRFRQDNPKFNPTRFMEACRYTP